MPGTKAREGRPLLAVAGLTLLFAAWLHQGWGGDLALLWMENIVLTVVPLGAAAACWMAARRSDGPVRQAWRFLAAATACWGLGSLVVTYVYNVQQAGVPLEERTIAVPGLADAFFLAFFPLAILGLVRLPAGGIARFARWRFALDGLLIVTCMLFLAVAAGVDANVGLGGADALRPDLCSALGDSCSAAGWVFAVLNPLGDVLLASVAVFVTMFAARVDRRALALLALGFLSIAVADVDFSTRWLHGDTSIGNLLDAGWVLGFGLVAAAALRPSPTPGQSAAPDRDAGLLAILPYMPFTVSAATAAAVQLRDGALRPVLFWIAFTAVGLVLVRQFVAMLDNERLRREAVGALERLRESEAFRSNLVHTVTHDLRNPLSPILLQLAVLARKALPGDVRDSLETVHRNVKQVERLVADLADVGKLLDGRLAIVHTPMDAADTLRDVYASFAPEAAWRGVDLVLDCPQALPVRADPIRVRQVLVNLVSNALKFTGRGAVSLRGRLEGGEAVVTVEDTGRGLTADEQARLFQAFSQVHDRREVPERGTGLGLYISKGIVEGLGGRIGVRSEGHGHGSAFWFRLPAEPLVRTEPRQQA